jgi:hypothetical protein
MANQNAFEGQPILCWTIDDWQQFYDSIAQQRPSFDLKDYINNYQQDVYERLISPLFTNVSIKLNLGGETEKGKIMTTDRPTGIFDFSLAAQGLYRVQEYFSELLKTEYPNKFSEYGLAAGVVPVNLVAQKIVGSDIVYYYEDNDGFFPLTKQQKGTAAVEEGKAGAKLDFATKTKKVYLTFKKVRGKVRYCEIYSVFYYTTPRDYSLEGDAKFAIRHIPALMVADYLEQMGIMTRVYMTRFVELSGRYQLREYYQGTKLPMFEMLNASGKTFSTELFVQPIIVKEFGQEIDKSLAFMVSSSTFNTVYNIIAGFAQEKEVENTGDIQLLGVPDFSQEEYYVGFERYRNKYRQYVDLGIFKSKETQAEALIFFHDYVIARQFELFCDDLIPVYNAMRGKKIGKNEISEALTDGDINPFFSWWMKLSANQLKDKINIINSNELVKDIAKIKSEAEAMIQDGIKIVNDTTHTPLKNLFQQYLNSVLNGYKLYDSRNTFSFSEYIQTITIEISTYADGEIYETDADTREKRDELVESVLQIANSL